MALQFTTCLYPTMRGMHDRGVNPGDLTGGRQVARDNTLTRSGPVGIPIRCPDIHSRSNAGRAALVELLPCPQLERVVEVRHSDFPPSALVVDTPVTNDSLSCLRPGDNKRTTLWISPATDPCDVSEQMPW